MPSLLEKYNEQSPTAPTVFVSTADQIDDVRKDEVYVLYCREMEWEINCFAQAALVNMVGIWKNKTDAMMNAVFMIPVRGKVTDCFIHIGTERVWSIGLAERKLPPPLTSNEPEIVLEEKDSEVYITVNSNDDHLDIGSTKKGVFKEWRLMDPLFASQKPGYFRIPFDNLKPQQSFRVDLYYTESLRMQNYHFSVSIPLQFSEVTVPQEKHWDDIVKRIITTIHHPCNGINSPEPTSPSHQIQISKHDTSTTIIATKAIPRKTATGEQQLVDDDANAYTEDYVKSFGLELQLNYSIVADHASGFLIGSSLDDSEITNSDVINHHILLVPPAQLDHLNRIPRAIYFLIDRSTRLQLIWSDIVLALREVLDGMNETEMFGITLFDRDMHMTWALMNPHEELKLHFATEENKTSATTWCDVYKPDINKIDSALNKPLIKVLDALQTQAAQSGHLPICAIINASQHQDEKETILQILSNNSNYDDQGCLKQRIFGLSIGGGDRKSASPYFLHYLSSISRGKTIQLMHGSMTKRELHGLLSETESPFVKDLELNIEFKNKQSKFSAQNMLYPNPVPDLYRGHPVLLKITLPNDGEHQMESIKVNGIVQKESGLTTYAIPVMNDQDDMKLQESFPMELALAESHLNQLHGTIWLHNGCGDDKFDKYLTEANAISDITGIPSPTRALKSMQHKTHPDQRDDSIPGHQTSSSVLPPRAKRREIAPIQGVLGGVTVVSVFNHLEQIVFGEYHGAERELGCCGLCCALCCEDEWVDQSDGFKKKHRKLRRCISCFWCVVCCPLGC